MAANSPPRIQAGRGVTGSAGRAASVAGVTPRITGAMLARSHGVGRSAVVARRRPAGLDRQLRRPGRSRGRPGRRLGAARRRHRRLRRRRRLVLGGRRRTGGGRRRRPPGRVGSPTAAPGGCCTATAHALAPDGLGSRRGRVRDRARRRVRHRGGAARRIGVAGARLARRLRVGSRVVARRPLLAWHEWDLPDMPWDASRVVIEAVDVAHGEGRTK